MSTSNHAPELQTPLSTHTATDLPCSPPPFQLILFFFALYLVAIGESGHKPCAQAFGADQFDGHDPQESKAKSSFFNWWYCCKSGGTMVTLLILNYIQDNLNWGLGFGIPCAAMVISLVIFLLGTKKYRYSVKVDKKSAFLRIGSVFVSSIRNWRTTPSAIALEEEARGTLPHPSSEQYIFLISVIEKTTGGNGRYSWFDNNLNRAHLDYFYWLLAGMSVVQMAFYVYSAKSYIYNRRGAV